MTDAIKLHETAATSVDRHKETKEQRKARVLARKKAREAEKELMKQLEIAAKKKQLLEEKKHELGGKTFDLFSIKPGGFKIIPLNIGLQIKFFPLKI